MTKTLLVFLFVGLAECSHGEKGQVLYEEFCGACHGNDGRGGQEGQIPPLADSAWINGAPDRALQVVLFGLMGEISVPSKYSKNEIYDLVMPPQGNTLTDKQIASILTYVRKSWGNGASSVTPKMVKMQRAIRIGKNSEFWQARDLLKKYPLVQKKE